MTKNNAQASAECLANYSTLNNNDSLDNCEQAVEESQEKIAPKEGEGWFPKEPEHPTPENCFLVDLNSNAIIAYKIELEECTTDVIVPNTINGIEIKTIGPSAFYDKTNKKGLGITSIVFPESLTRIREFSFF